MKLLIPAIADGRTDLVFEHLAQDGAATDADDRGVPLIRWCAYYGDVSAIRHLIAHGEKLETLGPNLVPTAWPAICKASRARRAGQAKRTRLRSLAGATAGLARRSLGEGGSALRA